MLIYNYQKEFIGIDESDLKTLGFSNLSQLRAESADFADLFVRTPGFIHNFKHVHWIDFVACADPSESSKVIINVNGKTFKATISIDTAYLTDSPTSKAYIVQLNNLKSLSSQETENISTELSQQPTPMAAVETHQETAPIQEAFAQEETSTHITPPIVEEEIYEAPSSFEIDEYDLPEEIPTPVEEPQSTQEEIPDSIEIDGFDLEEEEPSLELDDTPVAIEEDEVDTLDENFDYDYQYDPQVASDELGLPIDLIEEFIQDFIAQANEFKDGLYSSLEADDIDNVKILSHKLKGVAANLRIEDALNTLTIINTSSDTVEIRSFLNTFYKIIAKLSGEDIQAIEKTQPAKEEITPESPELSIDVKEEEEYDLYQDHDENLELETPEREEEKEEELSIEIPELADDDFLAVDVDTDDQVSEEIDEFALSIEEEEDLELTLEEDIEVDDLELSDINLEDNASPQEIELSIEEPEEISYSKEEVASEIGLDSETFNELFNDFITEGKLSIQTMDDALAQDNFAKLSQEAVKLKGMSDNMRINSFNKELDILINNSEKNEMIDALKSIEAIIEKISR